MLEIPEPIDPVESKKIYYKDEYKYQLTRDLWTYTGITGYYANTEYITLWRSGWMLTRKGYAYDGASGPTVDTKSSMRCSAAHDCLYQLCREGFLPKELQPIFDDILERIGKEDGMWRIRANFWERMLNLFGWRNLEAESGRKEKVAP